MSVSEHPRSSLARRVDATTQFYDYTHYPYQPVTDPTDKWSSSFVLEAALAVSKCPGLDGTLRSLDAVLGVDRTVWGVKRTTSAYSWELYFYDYTRNDPRFMVSRILEVIGRADNEHFPPSVDECPRRPFMFSIDLDHRGMISSSGIHFYFYNVGERMTGLSYGYSAGEWTLENHYAFYDPAADAAHLREKIDDSPHLSPAIAVPGDLISDLLHCRRVCVANKPRSDGMYFGGVTVQRFIKFMEYFQHPPDLIARIRSNAAHLDHLLYDVAFDYGTDVGGDAQLVKTAFYGTV